MVLGLDLGLGLGSLELVWAWHLDGREVLWSCEQLQGVECKWDRPMGQP